jgi:signal transduction histidine kinase/CHASE3 domain sensor protein
MLALSRLRAREIAIAAVVILLGVVGVLTWDSFTTANKSRSWVHHTYDVLIAAKDLGLAVRDAETGQRGYVLTGDENYLTPYHVALGRLIQLQHDLREFTADNPIQQERLQQLAPLVQRKLEEFAQAIQLRHVSGQDAASKLVQTDAGRQLMLQIDDLLGSMVGTEQTLLAARLVAADRSAAITRGLALGGTAGALGLLLAAALLLSSAQSRLAKAAAMQRNLINQLRTTLDSVSQGIGVFDADRKLVRWNPCLPVLLGLPDSLMRVGTPYKAIADQLNVGLTNDAGFLEPEDAIRHQPLVGNDQPLVVYERLRADGRSFEIRRTAMPPDGFVLTVSDITERQRVEAVARNAQRMKAVGQLTGGISHDFNNLLAVIVGNLEMALTDLPEGSPLRARLDRAMWAATRGATLTQQLLAFARRQPLAPQPLALSAILLDMADLLRRTLGEQIAVRVVDAAGLWPAMTDAAQVESAILNLALNARDVMPNGGRLTIELANEVIDAQYARQHAELTPGDYVMVAVSDTGTGMAPEVLARAFEPFFSTKEAGRGSGLGLAMIFGFAKQSGGHVNIYSELGEGTTVRLYLPRAVGAPATRPRESAPLALPLGKATILVVEDDPGVRDVAASILRNLGYHVLEAQDGATALDLARTTAAPIGLALLDVILPGGMKGDAVARRLKENRPDLPILFMSGYTENAIVHHGRLDDGVALIGKPFRREQLARRVADLLAAPAGAHAASAMDDGDP